MEKSQWKTMKKLQVGEDPGKDPRLLKGFKTNGARTMGIRSLNEKDIPTMDKSGAGQDE